MFQMMERASAPLAAPEPEPGGGEEAQVGRAQALPDGASHHDAAPLMAHWAAEEGSGESAAEQGAAGDLEAAGPRPAARMAPASADGAPLPDPLRGQFERTLGSDLSAVRV